MAVITKITTQKKNQDRFNIYIDDGKGEKFAFSIDSDVLIKFQLKKGMELDPFSIMEVQYQDDIRKAYHLAIHYLARRIRSEKEVKDYLIKKDVEEPIINEVLHKLSSQKYINDEEYALAYVRTQANTTDKGPELIRIELNEKGIDPGILTRALEEYSQDKQIEKAIKISEKMQKKSAKESIRVQQQKLEQMLLRKGYSFAVIQMAVQESTKVKEVDVEMEAIRYQGEKAKRRFSQYSGFEFNQKMKQALYRKGFSIDLIEKYLSEMENKDL